MPWSPSSSAAPWCPTASIPPAGSRPSCGPSPAVRRPHPSLRLRPCPDSMSSRPTAAPVSTTKPRPAVTPPIGSTPCVWARAPFAPRGPCVPWRRARPTPCASIRPWTASPSCRSRSPTWPPTTWPASSPTCSTPACPRTSATAVIASAWKPCRPARPSRRASPIARSRPAAAPRSSSACPTRP